MDKRVFLVVLDSFGIGGAPDAADFGDEGSNTLAAVLSHSDEAFPNLAKMGLFDIDGNDDPRIKDYLKKQERLTYPWGWYGRIRELSKGKDSVIGHWEMAGVYSSSPLPTYPEGFPEEIISALKEATGRNILCNKPYSGTEVIKDYGEEHMKTGALIVYTSADSVLQIAAHEDVIPVEELYDICEKAREIMTGKHGVGRVIARPFEGTPGNFVRTSRRHDYSLAAPSDTMLDTIKAHGLDVISIGKIRDLFAQRGITEAIPTSGNTEGIKIWLEKEETDFGGLCYLNLVDFDMKYGHRNDIEGYNRAMHEFDDALGKFLEYMRPDDLLIITADHGCDPSTESTDHSRECVPLLIYGDKYNVPHNMGTTAGFGIVAQTVYDYLFGDSLKRDFEPATASHIPDKDNIMSYVDMTNLKNTATTKDIKDLVERAISENAASVCVQPCFVRTAREAAKGRLNICTVIGFPMGYQTTAVKKFEAEEACDNGASEIDMVININMVKSAAFNVVANEIHVIAEAVHKKGAILKVIIETCALTETEKKVLCQIVTVQGADFIKTSTGFGSAGATVEDVRLLRRYTGSTIDVKAAGGIRTKEDAQKMIEAGASRIGASNLK